MEESVLLQNDDSRVSQSNDEEYKRCDIASYFKSSSRIFYPIRPLFTLCIGTAISLLTFIGAPGWLVYIGTSIIVDDLIFSPLLRTIKSGQNINQNKKIAKSIISILLIVTSLVAGGLLGYFLFLHIPMIFAVLSTINGAIDGGGILLLIMGSLALGGLAKCFDRPVIFGILVAAIILLFVPNPFSVAVNIIAMSTVVCGFIGAIASKQMMRLYYYLTAGHTNVDGYRLDKTNEEIVVELNAQKEASPHFRNAVNVITIEQVETLRNYLQQVIKTIKKKSSVYDYLNGISQSKCAAFKDILHHLVHKPDLKKLSKLLKWAKQNYNTSELEQQIEDVFPRWFIEMKEEYKMGQVAITANKSFENQKNHFGYQVNLGNFKCRQGEAQGEPSAFSSDDFTNHSNLFVCS